MHVVSFFFSFSRFFFHVSLCSLFAPISEKMFLHVSSFVFEFASENIFISFIFSFSFCSFHFPLKLIFCFLFFICFFSLAFSLSRNALLFICVFFFLEMFSAIYIFSLLPTPPVFPFFLLFFRLLSRYLPLAPKTRLSTTKKKVQKHTHVLGPFFPSSFFFFFFIFPACFDPRFSLFLCVSFHFVFFC